MTDPGSDPSIPETPHAPPGWREPPPPPEIPELLRETPTRVSAPKGESPGAWKDTAKAWGLAIDFIVTILAGAAVGWAGATWIGGSLALWVMGGLGLGFAMALTRIIRQTMREERARGGAGSKPGSGKG